MSWSYRGGSLKPYSRFSLGNPALPVADCSWQQDYTECHNSFCLFQSVVLICCLCPARRWGWRRVLTLPSHQGVLIWLHLSWSRAKNGEVWAWHISCLRLLLLRWRTGSVGLVLSCASVQGQMLCTKVPRIWRNGFNRRKSIYRTRESFASYHHFSAYRNSFSPLCSISLSLTSALSAEKMLMWVGTMRQRVCRVSLRNQPRGAPSKSHLQQPFQLFVMSLMCKWACMGSMQLCLACACWTISFCARL